MREGRPLWPLNACVPSTIASDCGVLIRSSGNYRKCKKNTWNWSSLEEIFWPRGGTNYKTILHQWNQNAGKILFYIWHVIHLSHSWNFYAVIQILREINFWEFSISNHAKLDFTENLSLETTVMGGIFICLYASSMIWAFAKVFKSSNCVSVVDCRDHELTTTSKFYVKSWRFEGIIFWLNNLQLMAICCHNW